LQNPPRSKRRQGKKEPEVMGWRLQDKWRAGLPVKEGVTVTKGRVEDTKRWG
jgi:hypothetical protein